MSRIDNFGDKQSVGGFQKNPQNINRSGANRKTVASINLELEKRGITEVSKDDIKSCYLRMINMTITELEEISESENEPTLYRVVAEALLSGKGFEIIEKLLERAIGKPEQKSDIKLDAELNIKDPFAQIRKNNGIDASDTQTA